MVLSLRVLKSDKAKWKQEQTLIKSVRMGSKRVYKIMHLSD